jgi:hypothetical protein
MTEPALRAAGRTAALSALRQGGARVARLDRRPRARSVLLRVLPRVIPMWFQPEAAQGLDASFELRLRNPGTDQLDSFAIQISAQGCKVDPGPPADPGATVTIAAEDMIRLVTDGVGWPELLSSGRLELEGDPFLALRFPSLFRLPVGA